MDGTMKKKIIQHKEIIIMISILAILTLICAITGFGTKLDHLLPANKIIPLPTNLTNPVIPTNLTFVK